MARLSERFNVVFVLQPADHGGAAAPGDSIHMGRVKRAMFIIQQGAVGTGNPVLTLSSGATNGAETTNETFRYRLADADRASANADQYADWATSSALTLTAATYNDRTLIVEIDSDELTDGQPWLTFNLTNVTAVTASVVAILEPRFEANDPLTVL